MTVPINRTENIRSAVKDVYGQRSPDRDEWADWMYPNHVLVVAKQARILTDKYDGSADIAEICGLLHDIADAITNRSDPEHEAKSLEIARKMLATNDYSNEEISLIVDDALRFHSCHNGEQPASLEGKILATADSYAHLETDFYFYAIRMFKTRMTYKESKEWVLAKLERDYHNKILFDDERKAWQRSYELFKELFSR